jgi:hypothetical protein
MNRTDYSTNSTPGLSSNLVKGERSAQDFGHDIIDRAGLFFYFKKKLFFIFYFYFYFKLIFF